MTSPSDPLNSKPGDDAASSAPDPLERILFAAGRADGEETAADKMPENADALFASIAQRQPELHAELERVLHAHIGVVEAPELLETRVGEASAQLRRPRILRFTPRVASTLAAAAVLIAVLVPVLSSLSSTPDSTGPRLVLRIVDEPLDTRFDGRVMFHLPQKSTQDGGRKR